LVEIMLHSVYGRFRTSPALNRHFGRINMARSIRSATLETRTARLKLPVTSRPVYVKIGAGLGLGYRRNATSGTWVARIADGRGGNLRKTIGAADDFAEANGRDVLDYWQASDAARRLASGNAGPAVVTLGDALDSYEADLRTRGRCCERDENSSASQRCHG
jgi:hypothetical protein